MRLAFAHRLDSWSRNIIPSLSLVALVLLSAIPFAFPFSTSASPYYVLIGLFYWTTFRPDLMPAPVVFSIGLLQDILLGTPIGLGAVILLAVFGVTLSQNRAMIGRPFYIVWLGFIAITAGAMMLTWVLASLLATHPIPLDGVGLQLLITIATFPFLVWLFVRIHRYIVI
jgi:rod shape-determining protein MreD